MVQSRDEAYIPRHVPIPDPIDIVDIAREYADLAPPRQTVATVNHRLKSADLNFIIGLVISCDLRHSGIAFSFFTVPS
ncbi:unnamed protein product, partial [Iphiclides podalirius]